jgi:hypothetical protein
MAAQYLVQIQQVVVAVVAHQLLAQLLQVLVVMV